MFAYFHFLLFLLPSYPWVFLFFLKVLNFRKIVFTIAGNLLHCESVFHLYTFLYFLPFSFLVIFPLSGQILYVSTTAHRRLCFVLLFQEQLQGYSQLYDLSRSERSKVHELAVTMATDGQPLECVGELLRVSVGPLDLSVKTVLHDAVERVVAALRYNVSPTFSRLIRKYKTLSFNKQKSRLHRTKPPSYACLTNDTKIIAQKLHISTKALAISVYFCG